MFSNYVFCLRSSLAPPCKSTISTSEPVSHCQDEYNSIDCGYVVHRSTRHRHIVREGVHDEREASPEQEHKVCHKPKFTEPEGTVLDVIASFREEQGHRNGIWNVQQNNTRGYHTIRIVFFR